jgi:Rieske Fe-S protein
MSGIAVTLAAVLYPIARFLRPRLETKSGATEVVAPFRVDELRPDANGEWPAPFNFAGKPCLVIRTSEGEIRAFNAVCTHTDCTVKFRPDKEDIYCTCHGGVYNTSGKNVSGPPPRPLEAYKVVLRGAPGKEDIVVAATG